MPRPLEGRVGRKLAAYCDLPYDAYLNHFERVNLLQVRQDTKENGFEFDLAAARVEADKLQRNFKEGQIVLLLGGRVAEAFGVHDAYFVKNALGPAEGYIVPHPSGVSRWWNEHHNRVQAAEFLRGIVDRTLIHV